VCCVRGIIQGHIECQNKNYSQMQKKKKEIQSPEKDLLRCNKNKFNY